MEPRRGRPYRLSDNAVLGVTGATARSKLQLGSERRAVINHIINVGGRATVSAINCHFGYDIRQRIHSLIRAGWLSIEEPQ